MYKLLAVVFLACASIAEDVRLQDRVSKIIKHRIIGGVPALISEAPWQVALLKYNWPTGYTIDCGGSIYSKSIIITAAHCVVGNERSALKIRAGSAKHRNGGQTINVKRIVVHELYEKNKNNRFDYDIAILFLRGSIHIDNTTTAPISLPDQGQSAPKGASAIVTGWGSIKYRGKNSEILRKVIVPVRDQEACRTAYDGILNITDRMICAGSKGRDACQGDSGGPLVVDGQLIGITSVGFGCGTGIFPGIWTRVSALRNWIDDVLKK